MIRWLIALAAAALFAQSTPASALACTFGISNLNFGNVDTLAGNAVDATATLSINCTSVTLGTVRICPNIGAGSGGATGSVRHMRNASNQPLNYSLYIDTGTTLWGSIENPLLGTPPTIDLTTTLFGNISTTRTIYGRVLANQQSAATGSYTSSFTAADVKISYSDLQLFNCLTLASPVTAPFTVSGNVLPNCLVSAQNISFGTRGVLTSNTDAQGQISVRCTPGTAYSVSLNGGLANAAPTARRMTLGAGFVTYGLYRDNARTQPWGSGVGQTVAGTGTGLAQPIAVFGRVPPQTTPAPGTYADTVVATVTY